MARKPYIGIKEIYYGEPITEEVTPSKLKTWLGTATKVTNSHDGSYSYNQDDPQTEDYINELTGKPYYKDVTSMGNKTIAFTMGEYTYEDMVALCGGEVIKDEDSTSIGWEAPTTPLLVYKAIVAKTKTGNYIVFTNAIIVGKTNMQSKNMGLGVTATAMESGVAGVSDEYRFDGDSIDLSL